MTHDDMLDLEGGQTGVNEQEKLEVEVSATDIAQLTATERKRYRARVRKRR